LCAPGLYSDICFASNAIVKIRTQGQERPEAKGAGLGLYPISVSRNKKPSAATALNRWWVKIIKINI